MYCRVRSLRSHRKASNLTHVCAKSTKTAHCVFEYIYFARPDSVIDGVSVYHSRLMAGRYLAMDSPVDADIVVGVPESGNAATLDIPFSPAFHTVLLL